MKRINFPFSAIVGQPQLKTALLLCAVDPTLGGVLIRGDKGTAKSTAARALTDVLPYIQRVASCAFNCLPGTPSEHCPVCSGTGMDAPAQPQAFPVPFITLPLGATEDRVLGTLDLQKVLDKGLKGSKQAFQPGLLAAAHRGILYIDEVNLLADHLVDVLLDAAAMGVNSVQREGLAITHPSRFTLIGTMNLEEGDLRPQLLDRFGLMVEVTAPREKSLRSEVVRRRIAFEADPEHYLRHWQAEQQALRDQLLKAQVLLSNVVLDDSLLDLISHLCCEFEVASLRADIVMHKASRALAALEGRSVVTPDDVRAAAELVLPHRRRRKPFEQPGLDGEKLDELMQQAGHDSAAPGMQNSRPDVAQNSMQDITQDLAQDPLKQSTEQQHSSQSGAASEPNVDSHASQNQHEPEQQQVHTAAASASVRKIAVAASSATQQLAGRRSVASNSTQGRVVRTQPDSAPTSLALGATLRSAAMRDPSDLQVKREDLHQQIRAGKTANLIIFVVDASGSMAAQRRMEAVKGAVITLLTDAYQQRDEVAVIAFRGEAATLLLAPTRSIDLAEQGLRELPTGGRTPLPHALQMALQTLEGHTSMPPLLVILSDGKANVALNQAGDAWRETLALADLIASRGVPALVLDTESGYLRLGKAAQLAKALGAECLTLEELTAENLAITVRGRTGFGNKVLATGISGTSSSGAISSAMGINERSPTGSNRG